MRERAQNRKIGIDPKDLSVNERLDSKDVNVECGLNDHRRVKHETSECELKQEKNMLEELMAPLNVSKSSLFKEGEMERR